MTALLERLRMRLAGYRGGLALAVLGLLSGLLAGVVIILFRIAVELSQSAFLPEGGTENYEQLEPILRIALVAGGGILIVALFLLMSREALRVGVLHVMERLAYFEGHLPLKNALMQFFGGGLALICGFSVGREGPSIHLGAASSSLLGQYLEFPNNSIRTLVACGSAAAIAASFNTPLAGVIFAMEVVMMEYTILGFTPVILAAVSATTLSRLVFGSAPAFLVPQLSLSSMWELPYIVVMGLMVGTLAAGFIRLLRLVTRLGLRIPLWQRIMLAGCALALFAAAVPGVMGIGYDSVDLSLVGSTGVVALLTLALAKLLATSLCVGLGIPGGLIGPSLVIGATAGAAFGLAGTFVSGAVSDAGLYAMLGMGAMMGASLQAPLAGLVALLELTANANLILPGMLAIVSANLTARYAFGCDSVFLSLMQEQGLNYIHDPIAQSLRRIGVTAVMSRSFKETPAKISRQDAAALLEETPQWIVVERMPASVLLPGRDLARYLEEGQFGEEVDLTEVPGQRLELTSIHAQATLQEALMALESSHAEALTVTRPVAPLTERILGIVTRTDIEANYRMARPRP